eukprot:scaffold255516_cov19-Prasinocladus_malaysianus.AAC.1
MLAHLGLIMHKLFLGNVCRRRLHRQGLALTSHQHASNEPMYDGIGYEYEYLACTPVRVRVARTQGTTATNEA